MRTVWTVFQYIFWAGVLALIVLSALTGASAQDTVELPIRGFIVRSGSMEPTIMTGDLIFISPDTTLSADSIVTYSDHEGRTVTHRVTRKSEKSETGFITKGDNNQTEDPYEITQQDVLGTYQARIPTLGYLLMETQSGFGLVLLFVIPLLMLIASELFKPEKSTPDVT